VAVATVVDEADLAVGALELAADLIRRMAYKNVASMVGGLTG
jgi:hypothetical protein